MYNFFLQKIYKFFYRHHKYIFIIINYYIHFLLILSIDKKGILKCLGSSLKCRNITARCLRSFCEDDVSIILFQTKASSYRPARLFGGKSGVPLRLLRTRRRVCEKKNVRDTRQNVRWQRAFGSFFNRDCFFSPDSFGF